jgi:LPS-assembly lipoprotein
MLRTIPAAVKNALVLILPLLLWACGFHLRGNLNLPPAMQNIYFQNASSQLIGEVKKILKYSNAQIVTSKPARGVIVNILDEQYRKISLSISTHGKTNEFELYYSLDYEIMDSDGKVLLPKKNMVVTRSFYYDQTQFLAKGHEENLLQQQIYKQAGGNIVESARVAIETAEKEGTVSER